MATKGPERWSPGISLPKGLAAPAQGMGRELFAMFRLNAGGAEQGGSSMLEVAGL